MKQRKAQRTVRVPPMWWQVPVEVISKPPEGALRTKQRNQRHAQQRDCISQ
mgnify:CR=1 FL=1